MDNYKVVKCCVNVYVPVDNIDTDKFEDIEDIKNDVIDNIEKVINIQAQNSNNILYQSTFEVYENDR